MVNVVAGVIMAVLVVAFIVIYFKVIRQSAMTHEEEPMTMQDLLGISEIRDGVVSIGENRHCKVIAVGSINYHLMSDEERDRVEGAFGSLLASLSFPIQIYVQTRLLDLSHAIEDLSRILKRRGAAAVWVGFEESSAELDWRSFCHVAPSICGRDL